jgi:hypothetical protein
MSTLGDLPIHGFVATHTMQALPVNARPIVWCAPPEVSQRRYLPSIQAASGIPLLSL